MEERPETPTALIERLSAEYDDFERDATSVVELPEPAFAAHGAIPSDGTGRHRRPGDAVVARDVVPGSRATGRRSAPRSTVRKLAPLGVGAAVALVAALVVSLVPQTPAAPELSSQLADATTQAAPAAPTAGGTTTSALPPPSSAVPAPRPVPSATKPAPSGRPTGGGSTGSGSTGSGTQAATKLGWTQIASDEFNGSGLSGSWGAYDGPGHDGKGRRTPDAISVSGGIMTIRGDSSGNTGGMAWNGDQTHGRWEIRARFPRGDEQYHPVLLLWPDNGWPPEVDFSETDSASDGTSFFLHYSSSNEQVSATRKMDITAWHNYAVEWVDGRVTGYVDGVKWFESTDGQTIPDVAMHLAIQLDYFPDGGSPKPTEMQVDYVRIYK